MFQWAIDSEVLRHIADICPSMPLGKSRKRIVSTSKVYEIDHSETFLCLDFLNLFYYQI